MPFKTSERVAAAAFTDSFMRGDRYGNVVKVGRIFVHVLMDRSGKVKRFLPDRLEHVI